MDETMIRKRKEREADFKATLDAMGKENDIARYLEMQDDLVNMLRAAYGDGLEAGAKIVEEGDYDTDIHAIAAIRQHAKEMGHE